MLVAALADAADLLLEVLLGGRQRGAAGRGVRPLGLQPGQLRLHGGEARRLGQRGAPVLQLGDGRVEVLDGQQVGEGVRHERPS